jgi:hypothetical protein
MVVKRGVALSILCLDLCLHRHRQQAAETAP